MKKHVFSVNLRMVAMGTLGMLVSASLAVGAVPYVQTWSGATTEGWEPNTTSSVVVHDAAVGNPAGSLATRRDLTPPVFDIGFTSGSVAETSGNFGGSPWTVSFDFQPNIGKVDALSLRYRYQDSTYNGWRYPFAGPFDGYDTWTNYSVTFDPSWSDAQALANGWVQDSAPVESFATTMGNAYRTEIRIGLTDSTSSAIAHVDNFKQQQVPEPTGQLLMSLALGGWGLTRRRNRA